MIYYNRRINKETLIVFFFFFAKFLQNLISTVFLLPKVGYNGLGFCCLAPESAIREGHCAARIPKHSDESCESECRSDPECQIGSKCCFDGCGLKCIPNGFPPNPFQMKPAKNNEVKDHNKG